MGREIRRVPAGWIHPVKEHGRAPDNYKPLFDNDYAAEADEWLAGLLKWEHGDDPAREKHGIRYFWDWHGGPPNPEYYRPKWADADRTHYQVYETVSEGTPVTPVCSSEEEVIDYLVRHGDFWDQKRGTGGWRREAAESFVRSQYAPSLVMIQRPGQAPILAEARDQDILNKETR